MPDAWNRPTPLDDPAAVAALAETLSAWEPSLLVSLPPRDAVLYEPDGTLYAVWLGPETEATVHRRSFPLRPGDALVLPRELVVDAGPDVDVFAVVATGTPPDHFRERFIQVWGVDHLQAPADRPEHPGESEVIPWSETRHRIPYRVVRVSEGSTWTLPAAGDPRVLVGIDGEVRLALSGATPATGDESPLPLGRRTALALAPETACEVSGEGRVGVLTLLNDLAHEARRRDARNEAGWESPERRPSAGFA